MKTLGLGLGLVAMLVATSASMAEDAGCAAFKWPVTREQALFAAAPAAQPGESLSIGAAVDLALLSVDQVSFAVAPERAPGSGTFGATASLVIPSAGTVQISLSDEAWIDVIQGGHAMRPADFSGVKTCPGIRKSVRFKLSAGPATIQFSGAKKAELKIAVLAPE